MNKIRVIIACLVWIWAAPAWAQQRIADDKQASESVKIILNSIYNFDFNAADNELKKNIKPIYGNHPAYHLLHAIQIMWENLPILDHANALALYKKELQKSLQLSLNILDNHTDNAEASFFALSAYSLIARIESEEGDYIRAVNSARNAYSFIKKGMELQEHYPEFYFTSGIYNYYRIQYPETNPIYKPFMIFFMDGNKELGIRQLELASKKSVFARVEALMFLSGINMRYEDRADKALGYTKILHKEYPQNNVFSIFHAEALIANNKFEEAEPLVAKLIKSNKIYQLTAANTLSGVIQEKKYKNNKIAKNYYLKSIEYGKKIKKHADNQMGLAYAGLARIALKAGENEKAKAYYKKALAHSQYTSVKNEAREYLK